MAAEKIKKDKSKQLTKITPKQRQIINLHNQHPNASGREIARLAKADPSYTIDILQRYGLIEQSISDYKTHRADILAGLQHRIISSITDEDIQKAPMGSRVLAAAQLYDKERLERGQGSGDKPMLIIVQRVSGATPPPQAQDAQFDVDITPNPDHSTT